MLKLEMLAAVRPPPPSHHAAKLAYETDAAGRVPCLDGLRALASWMVVVYHFTRCILPWENEPAGYFGFFHYVPILLWEGVNLFLVLSGFLIAGILFDNRESPRFFSTFYLRRGFRILPVYYVLVLSYVVGTWLLPSAFQATARLFEQPLPLWVYLAHLQNFGMAMQGSFGPAWLSASWTLALEEQFYLLLPLFVRRFSPRQVIHGCVAAWILATVLRASIHKWNWMPSLGATILLPTRLDGLAMGAVAAYLCRYHTERIQRYQRWFPAAAIGGLAAVFIFDCLPTDSLTRFSFLRHTFISVIFTVGLLALVTHPQSRPARWLSTSLMHRFGNYSYSLYLFHVPILSLLFFFEGQRNPVLATAVDLGLIVAALVLSYLAAAASWRWLEQPMLRRGRRFQY